MLKIRRLRLVLPAGFAGRPEQAARLVGEELARLSLAAAGTDRRIRQLAPPPVEVGARPDERAVAEPAARAVARALERRR